MTTIASFTAPSVLLGYGEMWAFCVETRDASGYRSSAVTPALTVTLPDASTVAPVFTLTSTGMWMATYTVLASGRFLAHASTPEDAVDFSAYVAGATANAALPDVTACRAFDPENLRNRVDADVQDALDAEAAAQRAKCTIRATYPADLAEALKRRVQVNLAMRPVPLAMATGDADAGPTMLPTNDPMVRRLEGPYRRRTVG